MLHVFTLGCETCRKRRIRCDGTRPICKQCKKSSRICFSFKYEGRKLTSALEHHEPDQWSALHRNTLRNRSGTVRSYHSPSAALNVGLEEQALAFYFGQRQDATATIEPAREHSAYALAMWMSAKSGSAFHLAVLATSYASLGNARSLPDACSRSRVFYCEAISKVKSGLQDRAQSCTDQVLLATMILSTYECACGSEQDAKVATQMTRAFTHHDGALAILKERRRQGLPDQRSLVIDKLCRRQLLRSALLRKSGVPVWFEDGAEFGETGLALKLDRYLAKVAQIQHRVETFVRFRQYENSNDSQTRQKQIGCMLEEARRLDNEMLNYEKQMPEDWKYNSHCLDTPSVDAMIFGHLVHTYSSLAHAGLWVRHRTVRIMLSCTIIELLSIDSPFLHEPFTDQARSVTTQVWNLVDEICVAIPYLMHKVTEGSNGLPKFRSKEDALSRVTAATLCYLAFPLHGLIEVFKLVSIPASQQQWIKAQMRYSSRAAGDKMLERIALQ